MKIIVTEMVLAERPKNKNPFTKNTFILPMQGKKDEYVCEHEFILPKWGEKDAYRSRVSLNAFFNSGKFGRNNTKTRLFIYRHEGDPDFVNGCLKLENINLPIYEHDSIWDFYKHIGYNYKIKKYGN